MNSIEIEISILKERIESHEKTLSKNELSEFFLLEFFLFLLALLLGYSFGIFGFLIVLSFMLYLAFTVGKNHQNALRDLPDLKYQLSVLNQKKDSLGVASKQNDS